MKVMRRGRLRFVHHTRLILRMRFDIVLHRRRFEEEASGQCEINAPTGLTTGVPTVLTPHPLPRISQFQFIHSPRPPVRVF